MWRTFGGKPIELPIKEAVEITILKELASGNNLRICIGSDSQVHATHTEFATVIVFVREKFGAFMYVQNEQRPVQHSLKERMLAEVAMSIDIAYQLCDLFAQYYISMEVHADINTNPLFKSNESLREAMGYILGMGFVFKAKPDAFASSCCADRMV